MRKIINTQQRVVTGYRNAFGLCLSNYLKTYQILIFLLFDSAVITFF